MQYSSHDVSISDLGGHDGIKESVYVDFPSAWRGEDVIVTMCASRYTHSSGLSDWQIYGYKVRSADTDPWASSTFTDTARQRLADKFRDEMTEWLKTDAYTASERRTYFFELRGKVRDLKPYSDNPSKGVRRLIDLYSEKIGKPNVSRLSSMCDSYDAFSKALDRGPWEPAEKGA